MNRPYEGTGLGLSIAKTLVGMMSGEIFVERKAESGAKFVFTVFFTLGTKEEVSAAIPGLVSGSRPAPAVAPGTRVLLVEDNRENVVLMRAYLEGLSLLLHFASNGEEAVEKRKKSDYDLMLMDIQMPVMDGLTATRAIRDWEKKEGLERVPIVALTAHALSGAAAASMEAGCDGHLTKPVDRNQLLETIGTFAKKTSAAAPAAIAAPIAALRPAFLNNRRDDLAKMREAVAKRNFSAIQILGHNCKGIGSGYGFPEFSTVGANVECAARALDAVQWKDRWWSLRAAFWRRREIGNPAGKPPVWAEVVWACVEGGLMQSEGITYADEMIDRCRR